MPRSKTVTEPKILSLFKHSNFQSGISIQQQIKNLVIFAINSGKLKPGEHLPSVPELLQNSELYGVAITTAYRELGVIGILSTRRGVGISVTPEAPAICSALCPQILTKNMYEVMQEAKAVGMDESIIKNIVHQCLKLETQPYMEAPAELMKLGKKKP